MAQSDDIAIWRDALARRCRRELTGSEAEAVACLPIRSRTIEAGEAFTREGGPISHCGYVESGVLCQVKLTGCGMTQIVGLRLRHEFVGLEGLLLGAATHDVCALSRCRLLVVEACQLRSLMFDFPQLGMTLLADAVVMGCIAEEWIVNVGRRDAHSRVAHLLCELALRTEGATLAAGERYPLPLTQAQLGDTVGLGRVAVNRVLRDFVKRGLVVLESQCITLLRPDMLEEIGDFSARYLHLGRSEQDRRKAVRDEAGSLSWP